MNEEFITTLFDLSRIREMRILEKEEDERIELFTIEVDTTVNLKLGPSHFKSSSFFSWPSWPIFLSNINEGQLKLGCTL